MGSKSRCFSLNQAEYGADLLLLAPNPATMEHKLAS